MFPRVSPRMLRTLDQNGGPAAPFSIFWERGRVGMPQGGSCWRGFRWATGEGGEGEGRMRLTRKKMKIQESWLNSLKSTFESHPFDFLEQS